MKNLKSRLLKLSLLLPAVLLQLHCGSNSTGAAAAVSYYTSNGTCYSSAGTAVSSVYCATSSATGYSYNSSGNCVLTSTGQIVSSSYCSGTYSSTTTSTSCVGTYYWCPYGISAGLSSCQQGYCSGTNCRGYTLYTQSGQTVVCQ